MAPVLQTVKPALSQNPSTPILPPQSPKRSAAARSAETTRRPMVLLRSNRYFKDEIDSHDIIGYIG
jgi:hypothetical protein